ncbi:MAG: hypothetical protein ACRDFC_02615, partial [Ignavibacteria bacterium]
MNKIREIIKGLKPNEFIRLGKFLTSPYYNQSTRMTAVYNFLQNLLPGFDAESITKESVFNYVYPERKYNELNARKLISNFTKLLEEFLAIEEYQDDKASVKHELLRAARKRMLPKTFNGGLRNLVEHQQTIICPDEKYYLTQLAIEEEILNFYSEIFVYKREQYQKISDLLDLSFVLSKLEFFYQMVQTKLKYPDVADFRLDFFKETLSYIEDNLAEISEKHPNIYVYYFSLLALLNPDNETYFFTLKAYVFKNLPVFPKLELKKVFRALYNYCINKIKKGIDRYSA